MSRQARKRPWWIRPVTWLIWAAAIVVFLVLALALASQTRPFKNWVRDYAVDSVNETINGKLSIERLDGNLFDNVRLSGIVLARDGDTLISVASVHVGYDLWALLGKTIKIDTLVIDSAHVLLKELRDSTWNLMHLLPEDTVSIAGQDTVATEFGYTIELSCFLVWGASVDILAVDSLIPGRLDGINLTGSGRYTSGEFSFSLNSLQLDAHRPELSIANLTFEMLGDTSHVAVKDFTLETILNKITAGADISLTDFARSTADVRADSIDVSEFSALLPPYIVALRPTLGLHANLKNDTLMTSLSVTAGNQTIDVSSAVGPVSVLIDSTLNRQVGYAITVDTRNLALAKWLDNPELDVLLNGSLSANGSGTDPSEMLADLNGDFSQCVVQGHQISKVNFVSEYSAGNLSGRADAAGAFGKIGVSGSVTDLLETPAYELDLELSHLDLGKLVKVDTLPTDINLSAFLKGTGFDLDSARGEVKLTIAPSKIKEFTIDAGYTSFGYSPQGFRIDTMSLVSSALTADVAGTLSRSRRGYLRYTLTLDDASMFTDLTGGNLLGGYGQIDGLATGNLEDLNTESRFEFSEMALADASVAKLQGKLLADYRDSLVSGSIRLKGEGIYAGGITIDSVSVAGRFAADGFDGTLAVSLLNGLNSQVLVSVWMDSLIQIILREISVSYAEINWTGGSDSNLVTISDDDRYDISHLLLTSESSDGSRQVMRIDGTVSLQGESSLQAVVENIDLKPLSSLYDLELGGKLSADFNLLGTAMSPRAEGRLNISAGYYHGFKFHKLDGKFGYSDRRAGFDLNFRPTPGEVLAVSGSVPMVVTLVDTSKVEPFSDTIFVSVKADRLPLEILKVAGYGVEQADGYISCDLTASNTLDNPIVSGTVDVRGGTVKIPGYGINYSDIRADIDFQPNRIILDSLVIRDQKGYVHLKGAVDYDTSIISGNISSSRFDVVARDFYAVRHRDYEIQINSDVKLEGTNASATYDGTLTVSRSRFYLPAFMKISNQDALDEVALPMLLAATLSDSIHVTDSILQSVNGSAASNSVQSAFVNNLRGELKIVIPKNTWISSPDLKLELAGDIDVVKQGPDFELFGNIRVIRGYYELYGKRFSVKKGELVFQGGADYIAGLDIEASHVFRTATREKKTLQLFVTGTSEVPILRFALDQTEISEGDAVSYILFGRSLDELTQGQRTTVSGGSESGSMAGSVAASLLAGQLNRAIGNRLNLDVIEIKAQGDLQSAAVVIGKYLTPDLFMSYQRSFGSASDDDLEPETVTLEYQLTRLIYLQLTEGDPEQAGFDVILKFIRQ